MVKTNQVHDKHRSSWGNLGVFSDFFCVLLCGTIAKIIDQEKVDIKTVIFRFPLGFLSKMLATLIEYETPKVVTVHNVSIGTGSSNLFKNDYSVSQGIIIYFVAN